MDAHESPHIRATQDTGSHLGRAIVLLAQRPAWWRAVDSWHRAPRRLLFMSAKSTEGESLSPFIPRQQREKTFVQYARRAPPVSGQEHRNPLTFSGYVRRPSRGAVKWLSQLYQLRAARASDGAADDGRRGGCGFCHGVAGVNDGVLVEGCVDGDRSACEGLDQSIW